MSYESRRYKIQEVKKYKRLINETDKKTRKDAKGIGKAALAMLAGVLVLDLVSVAAIATPLVIAGGVAGMGYKTFQVLKGVKRKGILKEKLDALLNQNAHTRGGYQ